MDALERQLAMLEPDLVAIQESFATIDGATATAARLGRHLGLSTAFVPARRKLRMFDGRPVDSHSGLALLSRWNIARHGALALPSSPQDGGRCAQLAVLAVGERRVAVTNVHLSHLPDGADLRRRQMEALLRQSCRGDNFDAAVLLGDFNAELAAPELRRFFRPPWGLVDGYAAGGGGAKITCRQSDGRGSDIDHILSIQKRHGELPTFCDSGLVLDVPDPTSGIQPSDHVGVTTTLVLRR
jgi:endonuclease/exonuclease/phosphatase family metal-dependent hydrolase